MVTSYGKFIFVFSVLLNVYVIPFVRLYYFTKRVYSRLQARVTLYYEKYRGPVKEENLTQIASPAKTATPEGKSLSPLFATIIVVDPNGVPTGLDPQIAFSNAKEATELFFSLANQIASAEVFNEDLTYVINILLVTVACLALRTVQLAHRYITREPIPASTPPALVRKYA